jgi:hypothetical protein
VNEDPISKGIFPFGGHLCTHWEYPAAIPAEPASVSTRRCQPDLDGCPSFLVYSGEACGKRAASDLNL